MVVSRPLWNVRWFCIIYIQKWIDFQVTNFFKHYFGTQKIEFND